MSETAAHTAQMGSILNLWVERECMDNVLKIFQWARFMSKCRPLCNFAIGLCYGFGLLLQKMMRNTRESNGQKVTGKVQQVKE